MSDTELVRILPPSDNVPDEKKSLPADALQTESTNVLPAKSTNVLPAVATIVNVKIMFVMCDIIKSNNDSAAWRIREMGYLIIGTEKTNARINNPVLSALLERMKYYFSETSVYVIKPTDFSGLPGSEMTGAELSYVLSDLLNKMKEVQHIVYISRDQHDAVFSELIRYMTTSAIEGKELLVFKSTPYSIFDNIAKQLACAIKIENAVGVRNFYDFCSKIMKTNNQFDDSDRVLQTMAISYLHALSMGGIIYEDA
jgi:hypothetical protein